MKDSRDLQELAVLDHEVRTILHEVWGHALDASSSLDFKHADGSLDEQAYLRYQRNVIASAAQRIDAWAARQR